MHSLATISVLLFVGGVSGRALQAATPVITPGPAVAKVRAEKRQDPDAVSLAKVLLTAIPESLRQVAATNLPAVSSVLWEEFLDDKKPWWFLELPEDIQAYLIEQFGPPTAIPNPTVPAWSSAEVTNPSEPAATSDASETDPSQSSGAEISQSASVEPSSQTGSSRTGTAGTTGTASTGSPNALESSTSPSPTSPAPPATDEDSEEQEKESHSGLSKNQKVGIGVGVPFAVIGLVAFAFGCCFLRRRRRNKSVNGSVPPSSPGFIPRFAFQEKPYENLDQHDLLYHSSDSSGQDLRNMSWDDDVIEAANNATNSNSHDQTAVMAPALFHTHSSNRARGRRTSYQSLHSVPEVSEPDEVESPVLPRHSAGRMSPVQENSSNRQSSPKDLIPPPMAAAPQIKRKPVPSSPNSMKNPTADLASQSLLRQTMPDAFISSPTRFGNHTEVTSGPSTQVSPIEEHHPRNPFSNNYSYMEDYGPEFSDPYIDIENGLYGGNTSFSRYPEVKKSAKSDWPLRNTIGRGHRRNKSPMWDRVYEN